MLWKEFKALGTDIVVSADIEPLQQFLFSEVESAIRLFEKKYSRFSENSDLRVLNDFSSGELTVGQDMLRLLTLAKDFYKITNGIFDPTIASSLEAVGYDTSFEQIAHKDSKPDIEKIQKDFAERPRFDQLEIKADSVVLPKGMKLDFGGFGKGYIVDLVSDSLLRGVANFWLSAGGDLLIQGRSDEKSSGFQIDVQHPLKTDENIFQLKTQGEKAGVATSGVVKRRGQSGDFLWHHIIDPRTGLPVKNEILSVTIIASNVVRADVFAKTVLILGVEAGLDFIEKQEDSAAIIFTAKSEPIFSKRVFKYII